MGDRHQRSAWSSGTVKAVDKQNMRFLPLALLFISACSDPSLPSVLQLLAIPQQTQGSTKQAGMRMMLSRLLQPGGILETYSCIAKTQHPPPGESGGSGGLQDRNLHRSGWLLYL